MSHSEPFQWNLSYNFLSATEKCAALEGIRVKLAKMETDIRMMIPMAGLTVQMAAMLEMMVPLLEAVATITPGNGNTEEHQRLLSNVRQAFGTQILSSELNRMITGTGSTTSAYYFVMGMTYYSGLKVKKDYKRSLGYFHEAVLHGNTESYLYLGIQYEKGHGVKWDRKKAFEYYKNGAHHGDADCQSEVGYYFVRGFGVKRDKKKGFRTLQSSASSGSVAAQYHLGDCFRFFGSGTEADEVQAVKYYKMAAEAGHVEALYLYAECWLRGIGVEKNSEYGFALMRTAANVGSADAMRELGDIYCFGLYGVEKDLNESFRRYSEAAKRNDANAMMEVGKCLIFGKGVVRNIPKGVQYLLDAGAAGEAWRFWDVFDLLAGYYRRGIGVKMNKKKSFELYHRSAKYDLAGHFTLGEMYKTGEGTRVNYEKAIHHFSIVANDARTHRAHRMHHLVHWELATIFERTKGFTNAHRALHHFRMVADIRRREDLAANRRVAEYFVRATPPRRMRFKHQEFQISLDKIRNAHSQRERDASFNIFSRGRPWRINSYPQTALLTSPESIPLGHTVKPRSDKPSAITEAPATASTKPSGAAVESSPIGPHLVLPKGYMMVPILAIYLLSLLFISLFTSALFFFLFR